MQWSSIQIVPANSGIGPLYLLGLPLIAGGRLAFGNHLHKTARGIIETSREDGSIIQGRIVFVDNRFDLVWDRDHASDDAPFRMTARCFYPGDPVMLHRKKREMKLYVVQQVTTRANIPGVIDNLGQLRG